MELAREASQVRAARQALRLTQSELGALLGLHYATINRAETGVRALSEWHGALLAYVLRGAADVDIAAMLVQRGPIATLAHLLSRAEEK